MRNYESYSEINLLDYFPRVSRNMCHKSNFEIYKVGTVELSTARWV